MVSSMPLMPSLFPNTLADGDGMRANINQRRRNDGQLGPSRQVLMFSAAGSTLALTEIELESFKFGAKDFTVEEMLFVRLEILDIGPNQGVMKVRIADSAGSVEFGDLDVGAGQAIGEYQFTQDQQTNTRLRGQEVIIRVNTITALEKQMNFTDKNIITTNFTISLRGNTGAVPTGPTYYKLWVYRRGFE